MTDIESLVEAFEGVYGRRPEYVAAAPGRVNLIGEHTDYNDGFVFPAAITYSIRIALAPRSDGLVRLHSLNFNQSSSFPLRRIRRVTRMTWSNYVRGVAHILARTGRALRGFDAVLTGDVPISSGLSSSAALEVASCLAFEAASGFELDPVERALLCQRAEREFVGVQCGIMDQFISALGRRDHALFIDTRSLDYEAVPLPSGGVEIVIGNTNKQRGLVDSEYNLRREQCSQAVAVLRKELPDVRALRDVSMEDLRRYEGAMDPTVFKRARHVVTENERVLRSVEALRRGDIALFGRLMNESHDSLRDDYEVSCRELDCMVELARSVPGVYGSRMTGAGFGGCTVSLVTSDRVQEFLETVEAGYRRQTGRVPEFYVCRAADGARLTAV